MLKVDCNDIRFYQAGYGRDYEFLCPDSQPPKRIKVESIITTGSSSSETIESETSPKRCVRRDVMSTHSYPPIVGHRNNRLKCAIWCRNLHMLTHMWTWARHATGNKQTSTPIHRRVFITERVVHLNIWIIIPRRVIRRVGVYYI